MQSGCIRSALELDPLQRTVESVSCPVSMPSVRLQAGSGGIGLAPGRNPFFQLNGEYAPHQRWKTDVQLRQRVCRLHAAYMQQRF